MFVGGIFQPRFTASLGVVVICGRELYRWGYLSKDGPNSHIRELGAIPLNAAEIFLILGFASIYTRMRYEGLLRNRKFYKRLFTQKINGTVEKVSKDIENAKNSPIKIWRDSRSLLPLHPQILNQGIKLPTERGMPGEISPTAKKSLPNIPHNSWFKLI